MRRSRSPVAAFIAVASLAAISCGDDDSAAAELTTDLQPAEEVESSDEASDASPAALGASFELGEVMMLIDSITVVEEPDTDDRPFLVVHVRSENTTGEEHTNPEISIVCSGSGEQGSGLAYSTWSPYETLPPDTFRDGFLWLTGPGDPRTGEPTSDCATPAQLRVQALTDNSAVAIDLDEEMIAVLNDDGCGSAGTEMMLEATIIGPPVVCATFGEGARPETRPG